MRSQFLGALLVASFFSGWYFYTQAHPCIFPRPYTIGSIDERFGLDREKVKEIIIEAETVWERALGRELFTNAELATFKIDFVYDDRQERSESADAEKTALDQKENASKTVGEQYTQLLAEYQELKNVYDTKVANYNTRLKIFNDTVATYNQAGGAPKAEYDELEKNEQSLKREEARLETEAGTLAALAEDINDLSAQGNDLITEYNEGVVQYNQSFTGGEEFTQGEFGGDAITIYHFKDESELKNVLVHEFGHAIGLPHVDGNQSIMYYLMDKQPATSELSDEDLAVLSLVCKPNESYSTRFHQFFSSIFIKLHLI
jgi:hypothetical protein